MALEMQDLMALKNLTGNNQMSAYEQYKIGQVSSRKASGTAVAALSVGIVGAVVGIGAWIFAPLYGKAKAEQAREAAQSAKELAGVLASNNQRQLDQLTALFAAERQERIAGDVNLTNTVNDSVSGSQQGTLTAQQAAELAASQATQQVMQQTFADAVTGRSSLNPTPVNIYSAPQPCGCPSGCGCNA